MTNALITARVRGLLDDARAVALPFVLSRLLIAVGFIVAYGISQHLVPEAQPVTLTEGLVAWDGTWYRDIAQYGYRASAIEGLRFFPLFPLLGKAFSVVTLGRIDLALVLIANCAAFFLAIAIRRLVLFERGSKALADRAVWFLCLFPGAFVLAWAYAESLWLFGIVVVFWAIRSRRWEWAIVAGIAVGLARPLGIVVALPVAIELFRVWRNAHRKERLLGVAAVAAPLAGTAVYLGWVRSVFGDGLLPYTVQNGLRGDSTNPIVRIWDGMSQMFGTERLGDGLHIPFAIAFVVLLVLSFRYWPVSYGLFAAIVLAAALGAQNLNSLERYGLNAFPIVLTLAVVAHKEKVEKVVLLVLAGGVVALSAMAWAGAYVP